MSKCLFERSGEETGKQKILMINTLPDKKRKKFKQPTNRARLSDSREVPKIVKNQPSKSQTRVIWRRKWTSVFFAIIFTISAQQQQQQQVYFKLNTLHTHYQIEVHKTCILGYCSHQNVHEKVKYEQKWQWRRFQKFSPLKWLLKSKFSLVKVAQSLERLRFVPTFTPNGKREFVPRDQIFPSIAVYCLLLLLKNKQFRASFI